MTDYIFLKLSEMALRAVNCPEGARWNLLINGALLNIDGHQRWYNNVRVSGKIKITVRATEFIPPYISFIFEDIPLININGTIQYYNEPFICTEYILYD